MPAECSGVEASGSSLTRDEKRLIAVDVAAGVVMMREQGDSGGAHRERKETDAQCER
jgi:hypothetical protein